MTGEKPSRRSTSSIRSMKRIDSTDLPGRLFMHGMVLGWASSTWRWATASARRLARQPPSAPEPTTAAVSRRATSTSSSTMAALLGNQW